MENATESDLGETDFTFHFVVKNKPDRHVINYTPRAVVSRARKFRQFRRKRAL
jgi:hypothetical protein